MALARLLCHSCITGWCFARPVSSLRRRRLSRSFSTCATAKFKVLFCTEDFPAAFQLTREQLQYDPDIHVACCRKEVLHEAISDAVVAVPYMAQLTQPVLQYAQRLKLIIQFGVGLEGVDIEQASRQGIWVANIPSSMTANAVSCAEHAIYLMIALLRQQKEMQRSIENATLGAPLGEMLCGKRVMIVGFGGIAKKLIPLLKPFQVHLTGVRKQSWSSLSPEEENVAALLDDRCRMGDITKKLPDIDLVVLACVQDNETKGMIDDTFLMHCKDGVKIVNICRGGLLHESAILHHLQSGKIGGLGLDVQWREPFEPNHEITKHPNVILTPHVAGVTRSSYQDMAKIVAREVQRIKAGENPTRIVNEKLLKQ